MNAIRDQNRIPTLLATLTNGQTVVPVKANPSNHTLNISNATGGTDNGPTNDIRDQNRTPVLMAVSNVDGTTPVPIYADSNGNLLINTL